MYIMGTILNSGFLPKIYFLVPIKLFLSSGAFLGLSAWFCVNLQEYSTYVAGSRVRVLVWCKYKCSSGYIISDIVHMYIYNRLHLWMGLRFLIWGD